MDEPRCKECDYDLCDRCAARRTAGGVAAAAAANDEGAAVARGRDRAYAERFYCGRQLGSDAIPGSDGQCGPSNVRSPGACSQLIVHSDRVFCKLTASVAAGPAVPVVLPLPGDAGRDWWLGDP